MFVHNNSLKNLTALDGQFFLFGESLSPWTRAAAVPPVLVGRRAARERARPGGDGARGRARGLRRAGLQGVRPGLWQGAGQRWSST